MIGSILAVLFLVSLTRKGWQRLAAIPLGLALAAYAAVAWFGPVLT